MSEIKKVDINIENFDIKNKVSLFNEGSTKNIDSIKRINAPEEVELYSEKSSSKEKKYTRKENNRIIEYHEYPDGTYTRDYKEGNVRIIERYDKNDILIETKEIHSGYTKTKYADGSWTEEQKNSFGQTIIERYDSNANLTSVRTIDKNGYSEETIYEFGKNGVDYREISYDDSGKRYAENVYYKDGTRTFETINLKTGEKVIKRYDRDGNLTDTRTIDSNGKEKLEYSNTLPGGIRQIEDSWDYNNPFFKSKLWGKINVHGAQIKNADGSVSVIADYQDPSTKQIIRAEYRFYQDGTYSIEIPKNNGKGIPPMTIYYDANGNIISSATNGYSYGYDNIIDFSGGWDTKTIVQGDVKKVEYYDHITGQLAYLAEIKTTGDTEIINVYDADGNIVETKITEPYEGGSNNKKITYYDKNGMVGYTIKVEEQLSNGESGFIYRDYDANGRLISESTTQKHNFKFS